MHETAPVVDKMPPPLPLPGSGGRRDSDVDDLGDNWYEWVGGCECESSPPLPIVVVVVVPAAGRPGDDAVGVPSTSPCPDCPSFSDVAAAGEGVAVLRLSNSSIGVGTYSTTVAAETSA